MIFQALLVAALVGLIAWAYQRSLSRERKLAALERDAVQTRQIKEASDEKEARITRIVGNPGLAERLRIRNSKPKR